MKKDKVITNYSKWSDFELSTLASRVVNAMHDSNTAVHFPSPEPDLATLEVLTAEFVVRHEIASRRGSALEISQKNESREFLLIALRRLAHHVNGVADGRASILLSTGLILAANRKRLDEPGIPTSIRLRDGNLRGQLRLDFRPVAGAWEYELELGRSVADSLEIQWIEQITTTSSRGNVMTGLVSGVLYHVRIRARNGRGIGDWSEAVPLLVR